MIKYMNQSEHDAVMQVADLMITAAKTAPKASGKDTVTGVILTGEDKDRLSEAMREIGKAEEKDFMIRDAANVDNSICVVIILIMAAQLLTGLGWFDTVGKHVGAGVIVPITGFANSMVAPALEYKKEGIVLGVGAKLFSLSGPVLVSGIALSTAIGLIYWAVGVIW